PDVSGGAGTNSKSLQAKMNCPKSKLLILLPAMLAAGCGPLPVVPPYPYYSKANQGTTADVSVVKAQAQQKSDALYEYIDGWFKGVNPPTQVMVAACGTWARSGCVVTRRTLRSSPMEALQTPGSPTSSPMAAGSISRAISQPSPRRLT
ncbi:MAG: hypothetical protein WCK77_18315, partial [Verrucomicrobiota bacterium]